MKVTIERFVDESTVYAITPNVGEKSNKALRVVNLSPKKFLEYQKLDMAYWTMQNKLAKLYGEEK